MYLVFTRMLGESYRRRLRSLLYLCDVFRSLINSLVCSFRGVQNLPVPVTEWQWSQKLANGRRGVGGWEEVGDQLASNLIFNAQSPR